jgi:acetyl esterase/lipase
VLQPTAVATTRPANSNVILYLPPGPVFPQLDGKGGDDDGMYGENGLDAGGSGSAQSDSEEGQLRGDLRPTPQQVLASTTSSTVVTLNYRLGYMPSLPVEDEAVSTQSSAPGRQQHLYRYPTPVHDTLTGFDWVLQNLRPAQLCVFGAHIGGSLAVMLALTEPRSVRASAAFEPICDWTGLDDYCTVDPADVEKALASMNANGRRKTEEQQQQIEAELLQAQVAQLKRNTRRSKRPAPADLVPLLQAREQFFDMPAKYFDSFASPILFLRSAGKDVPKTFPKYLTGPEYPVPVLQRPELQEGLVDLWDIYTPPDDEVTTSTESATDTSQDKSRPMRRRKALSRWPPYGLDYGASGPSWADYGIRRLQVTLPWVRLFARGDASVTETEASASNEANPDSGVDEVETTARKRRASASCKGRSEGTIMSRQAEEMVSAMRRACFWGREKGYAERRVGLTWIPEAAADALSSSAEHELSTKESAGLKHPGHTSLEEEAGQWFQEIMEGKHDPD